MADQITEQLAQFLPRERAEEHVAFVRMAAALVNAATENEALRARLAEIEREAAGEP